MAGFNQLVREIDETKNLLNEEAGRVMANVDGGIVAGRAAQASATALREETEKLVSVEESGKEQMKDAGDRFDGIAQQADDTRIEMEHTSAEATSVPAASGVSVTTVEDNGRKIVFSIPRGERGDAGNDGRPAHRGILMRMVGTSLYIEREARNGT